MKADLLQARGEIVLLCTHISVDKLLQLKGNYPKLNIKLVVPKGAKNLHFLKRLEDEYLKVLPIDRKVIMNMLVVDYSLVWYGTLPEIGNAGGEGSSLLRLESPSLVSEVLSQLQLDGLLHSVKIKDGK
ncbi:hypothetical protein ACVRXQ_10750 [Streptococcus panodentis]|uniref:Uncharacterized protein n=1 Tax=Streptococcus panodentis TaxID=1581472 RepID=A0ABS5AZ44_9STRE|nr:hypothetical protein [Streptococcus panodentis]MBP2621536.1 hypothetical protein [Streptococcus panodentis]